ncbi:uracil-DNA glycosylase family protein [Sphingomonas flavalba]|uniref:uracil-DNA glycosylase family protein n=1 Tax=Sphingomonas flavalba TaxID=2559804 RepID=UPI001EF12DA0|nr:uracil-DNA glycosylase family protein [Sphingomonas flavalba]
MLMPAITAEERTSLLAWWREAGVDTLVGETPFAWLAPPERTSENKGNGEDAAAARAPTPLPGSIAALDAWLAGGDDVPGAAWGTTRIAAAGDPAAALMIVTGQPEPGDAGEGRLFGGALGQLFDRMLAAIGQTRESVYLAPIAPVRAPGGTVAPEVMERLGAIMRHRIALAGPKRVLVLGNAASRALLGTELRAARGSIRALKHGAGTVEAVASFPPRMLLEHPAAKAEAWKDLLLVSRKGA